MATHSSVLAWRIPGMGEPGGLPSMGSHSVGHDQSDLAAAAFFVGCSEVSYFGGFIRRSELTSFYSAILSMSTMVVF